MAVGSSSSSLLLDDVVFDVVVCMLLLLTDELDDAFDFAAFFLLFVLLRFGPGFFVFALDLVTAAGFLLSRVLLLAFEETDVVLLSSLKPSI